MKKSDRFLTYFNQWRGETVATKEAPYVNTALLIEAYVNHSDTVEMIARLDSDPSVIDTFRQYSYLIYSPFTAPEKGQ